MRVRWNSSDGVSMGILSECSMGTESVFHQFKDLCESPIERIALAALMAGMPRARVVERVGDIKNFPDWSTAIVPQMPMHGYRLDFGIILRPTRRVFALECDGLEFHRDRRREDVDRTVNLWMQGVISFRVSGSALHRDAATALRPFFEQLATFSISDVDHER